ncbi:abscisic acid receptor PYR1-like [Solanum pennellii]|uniref:Abscisic acid receptor PYR1-like n=1 Tax=Solanum pennellii TaxID=28526 RepID=A0ABM1HD40_SOLPN|nr:abscisic acid receptor PYR1-like [Solanum pennellii]
MDNKPETSFDNPVHQRSEPGSETGSSLSTITTHHLTVPPGLTPEEFQELSSSIAEFHSYRINPGQCSSLLAQRIHAPVETVWTVVRRFDKPQTYKHFIKSCSVGEDFRMTVGSTRDVTVISGLPAATSTERLDILDDDRHVTGFSIIGGEHRLRNYRSVTTVHGFERDGEIWTVVLESYVVDVPEGNTEEDTRLFADTVVKLNLQKLASVTETLAREAGNGSVNSRDASHR